MKKITEPNCLVHIYFLRPQLKVLADINIAYQIHDWHVYHSYSKISTLVKTIASSIVKDNKLPPEILFSAENTMIINPYLYGKEGK